MTPLQRCSFRGGILPSSLTEIDVEMDENKAEALDHRE